MRYTTTWFPLAERRLTDLWLAAADKAGFTRAANEIERSLARDPLRNATELEEGFWELVVSPLVVMFSISEEDRRVTAVDVELSPEE